MSGPYFSWMSRMRISETPMLEIIAESGGALRLRRGANAIRSSSTPATPHTTKATMTAGAAGTPCCIANSAVNAPSVNSAGCARLRMSSTLKTSVKPSAKSA